MAELLPKTALKTPFAQRDLLRSVERYRHLSSEWVVVPRHCEETPVFLCFVSPLSSESLEAALLKHGPMGAREAVLYMRELGMGMLELVNEGLWHSLFGPKNVLLHEGKLRLRAVDLESILVDEINEYSAPETVAYNKLDYKSNVWSFGMLLYRMMFGLDLRPSSRQEFLEMLRQPIPFPESAPFQVVEFLRGCLQFDPALRFSWEDVFTHPLWEGFFHELLKTRNLAESKLKFLIRKLRESVTRFNLNI
jgi:hypothetical protein